MSGVWSEGGAFLWGWGGSFTTKTLRHEGRIRKRDEGGEVEKDCFRYGFTRMGDDGWIWSGASRMELVMGFWGCFY